MISEIKNFKPQLQKAQNDLTFAKSKPQINRKI